MSGQQQKKSDLLWLALEAVGSLVLVLGAFFLFMSMLNAIFPTGTPLREIIQGETEFGGGRNEGRQREATLTTLLNDVRCRRGNAVAWAAAREGMILYTLDAVQTLDSSGARISFTPKDHLSLGANSLALVERSRSLEVSARALRVTVKGEVDGTFGAGGKTRLELKSRGQVARIGRGGADFRLVDQGRGSSTLSVYSGSAELSAGGRSLKIPANCGVTLRSDGVGGVFRLPPAPRHQEPRLPRYTFREVPPKLRFSWSGGSGAYHLQIAADRNFAHPVKDLRLDAPHFQTGLLNEGEYYWRVSRVERGVEGRFSTPARLELRQRQQAPELEVSFPPERVGGPAFTLTGSAAPGSRIFVNGAETATDSGGRFSVPLQLSQGVNLIRVEALDEAGNARYASRIVYGKF